MNHKYCKAYYLKDLRQFSSWVEQNEDETKVHSDEEIVYLWDDFTVVKSPVLPGGILFDQVTPEWQDFCKKNLQFKIPDDLLYAYEDEKKQEISSEKPVEENSAVTL